eukprot:scaffold303139_cov31-Tisochrysis_lutea.AAC.3
MQKLALRPGTGYARPVTHRLLDTCGARADTDSVTVKTSSRDVHGPGRKTLRSNHHRGRRDILER